MNHLNSIPIRELSDISSQLTRDEMNNVRNIKKEQRDIDEKKIVSKRNELRNIFNTTKLDAKEKIIKKLKTLLSKKYDLDLNDYIILIDKFKLSSTNIDRTNIIDLIKYLNIKSHFSQTSIDSYHKIDGDKIDSNFDKLEMKRTELLNKIKDEHKIDTVNKLEDVDKMVNNFDTLEKERTEMLNKIIQNSKEKKISANPYNDLDIDSKYNIIENTIKDNIILDISQKTRNKFDISSKTSNKNIKFIESNKTDILLINLLEYEINGEFCVTIDYNNQDTIENIENIEFIACNTNKTFCDKNGLSKKPHFIIRIEEFENNFFVNGNGMNGFCQILLEKKNTIYSYVNKAQIFGIFKPKDGFKLNKLNISIIDLHGNKLNNFKYTDNDQFNIILKIERKIM